MAKFTPSTDFPTKLFARLVKQHAQQIRKRDGQIVPFDHNKIALAIMKAMHSVNEVNKAQAKRMASEVAAILTERLPAGEIPTVEGVQDIVTAGDFMDMTEGAQIIFI